MEESISGEPPWEPIVCGLLWHDGRVLITRRTGEEVRPELWELTGGHQAPGETPEAALRREFVEELGLEVEVGRFWLEQRYRYPNGPWVWLRFYLCRLRPGAAPPASIPSRGWVSPAELAFHTFPAANAQLLRRIQEEGEPVVSL